MNVAKIGINPELSMNMGDYDRKKCKKLRGILTFSVTFYINS